MEAAPQTATADPYSWMLPAEILREQVREHLMKLALGLHRISFCSQKCTTEGDFNTAGDPRQKQRLWQRMDHF